MNKIPNSLYKIRFSDCDLFGHLNNARYLDYFLNAREDHLKDAYNVDLSQFYKQGFSWVVGSHDIRYIKPANYQEKVLIQTALLKVTEDLLLVEMVMSNEEKTKIKAVLWTRFVPVNVKTGQRQDHPAAFMEFARSIERTEVPNPEKYDERMQTIASEIKTNASAS
ncbi:MAG: acyl-CoA thioesterase [Chitinophagaceae bacterium]|nr:acyl-CoA thioesterase [Chitinophagaceae bacterium]